MSTASSAAAVNPATGGRPLGLSRLSDELLARHAARGSRRAFGALYERYHQPLYRYCRSIVRDEGDAQDALQSTFTSALAALLRDGRNAPLRPWLYRIAHNESVSLLRRRTRDAAQPMEDATLFASSAEDEAEGRARWRRLLEDLAELPERQRGALLLREMAGLSHEEIALALSLTLGGAKQAIFEARQGLAEVEEGRAMSCEEVRRRLSEGDRRILRGRRLRSHLRGCSSCDAFASAIAARQSTFRALAPLPPAAAAAILGQVIHASAPQGGAAAIGSAATAGAVGKATGAVAGKVIAGAALVTTAAAGVAGLTHVVQHHHAVAAPAAPRVHRSQPAPAISGSKASSSRLYRSGAAATAPATHGASRPVHASGGSIRARPDAHRAGPGQTEFRHGDSRWAGANGRHHGGGHQDGAGGSGYASHGASHGGWHATPADAGSSGQSDHQNHGLHVALGSSPQPPVTRGPSGSVGKRSVGMGPPSPSGRAGPRLRPNSSH